jgi:uncharacterized protein YbjT (DUF2867 family)
VKVLVTGATGFVGHHLLPALLAAGHSVVALSRNGQGSRAASGQDLGSFAQVEYRKGDVASGTGLAEALAGVEAVIHLVGIIAEKGTQTFERVHVEGTRNLMTAVKAAGIRRYLQMSALGASATSKSGYAVSKFQAETLVRASNPDGKAGAGQLDWTIFRPSLVFGAGDDFFGRVLRGLVTQGPIVPVIGDGHFPFRPIWAGDVAEAFVQALTNTASIGQTYSLVGPKEYRFDALLDVEMQALGLKKPKINVPVFLMNLAVPMMQLLPSPPITTHQYAMLLEGNTADPAPMQAAFRLTGRELEQELPHILGKSHRSQPKPA